MTINYFFVVLFLAGPIFAKNMGSFNISGYGPIYVVTDEEYVKNVEMHENGFTLRGGGRIYFSKESRDDFHPDMYWAVSYSFLKYSHLFNKRGAWNKRGGGAKVAKSLNVEVGINVEAGIFLKKLVHDSNKRGVEGGKI